jgi:hypothetical protein
VLHSYYPLSDLPAPARLALIARRHLYSPALERQRPPPVDDTVNGWSTHPRTTALWLLTSMMLHSGGAPPLVAVAASRLVTPPTPTAIIARGVVPRGSADTAGW